MSSTRSESRVAPGALDLAAQLAALQAELAANKAEMAVKLAALEDTITNLAHENALLKRRLYIRQPDGAEPDE